MANKIVVDLLKNEIGNMQDNLYRLGLAARSHDMNALYGESGETLADIKRGYEERLAEVRAALEEVER